MYLLIEHWSRSERFAVLKVLGYKTRIWERFHHDHPRSPRFPAVVAVIVHHGRWPWNAPTTLLPLTDTDGLPPEVEAELRPHVPVFRILLDDLVSKGAAGIRDRDLSPLLQLTFLCMQEVRGRAPAPALQVLTRAGDLVEKVLRQRGGKDDLDTLWCYVTETSQLEGARLHEWIARKFGKRGEASIMNTMERLKAEGRADGIAKGRAEMLLRVLRTQFGRVPASVAAKVRRASIQQLDRWADRLHPARSLTEVFGRTRSVRNVRRRNG